ncbi:MAG: methyl-accepting chemotaxis protein [Desulfobacula sp.]|nr:methyl-accepting chemotaxis protein [Desulfobacula sp.]
MDLATYYKRHGWIRSALSISMVVLCILVVVICIEYFYQKQMHDDNMENRCREISASIVGGMTDALSIGDNDIVREQFKRLHEVLPEIDVFVYDFRSKISFSTDPKTIGLSFNSFLDNPDIVAQNQLMLSTGRTGGLIKKKIDGKLYIGSLLPSKNEKGCFHCHGSSRQIIGGIAVFVDNSKAEKSMGKSLNISIFAGVVGVIVVVFTIWLIFSRMVSKLNITMDEIRDTSDCVATYSQQVRDISNQIDMNAGQGSKMADQASKAAVEITEHITSIASAAEEVSSQINDVNKNSTEVSSKIITANDSISKASDNIGSVAAAAEQMSFAVNTVATAMEQMYASQSEITKNSSHCAAITSGASKKASRTFDVVNNLGEAATQIGDIIDLINGIAGKTNLLALNAAIEAAGAGDAGKGFAVVANEVKELAKQTSGATRDIRKKIEGMQENTKEAIEAIEAITKVIAEVDAIMGTIASSVEEQTATTNEVTRNVAESAESAESVAANISLAAEKTEEVSENMKFVMDLEMGLSDNLEQTAVAVGEIAKDVTISSRSAKMVSDNCQRLSKSVNEILNSSMGQKEKTDQLADIAVNLKKLTKAFRI